MAVRYLLPKDGFFYKANLHCHSTCSDGCLTPAELKEAYKLRGYQVIAFTDHRVCTAHSELNDPDFLALTGTELDNLSTAEETGWPKACHLCCVARKPGTVEPMTQLRHGGPQEVNATIRQLKDQDFLIHYNHPVWSAHCTSDYVSLKGLSGFEIYNHCSEVYGMEGNGLHEYILFLKSGGRAYPVAADDNHNRPNSRRYVPDAFGGFNCIKAPSLTYDDIIAALEAGHTYASTGPMIYEYTLEGTKLRLVCSPVAKAILKSSPVGLNRQSVIMPRDVLTDLTFDLADVHGFASIQLYAADGTFACTPPVYEEAWRE